ncbi:FecR family protein [Chitinophaga rhizosphaerae]|uniref:FecR family protein n=1 Tax=Chitinophaga rhizosphaerae TaxID=1864947 RepID=UPI000F7FB3F5|nr:FecR family protein [Chitinophaga rhizosphaerae]
MEEEYLMQLMSEKLGGVIAPEDDRLLEDRIATDPSARQAWDAYRARFSDGDLANGFARAAAIDWPALPARRSARRRKLYYSITAAAAVAAGICYFIIRPAAPAAATIASTEVTLVLADGRELKAGTPAAVKGLKMEPAGMEISPAENAPAATMNTLYVPPGKDYRVKMPDGSTIWVNAASTLRFPADFGESGRTVELTGEAFFDVAPDPEKPFVVRSGGGEVTVLGTTFNVKTYKPGEGRVSLLTGAVKVRRNGLELQLTPGREASWTENGGMTEQGFKTLEAVGWKEGAYYFDDAPLPAIADAIGHWYGIKVQVEGEARFSCRLDRQLPLNAFLQQLSATGTLSYSFGENGTLLLKVVPGQ